MTVAAEYPLRPHRLHRPPVVEGTGEVKVAAPQERLETSQTPRPPQPERAAHRPAPRRGDRGVSEEDGGSSNLFDDGLYQSWRWEELLVLNPFIPSRGVKYSRKRLDAMARPRTVRAEQYGVYKDLRDRKSLLTPYEQWCLASFASASATTNSPRSGVCSREVREEDGVEQFNSGAESPGSGCRASPSRPPRERPHCKPKAVPRAQVDIMVERLARPRRQRLRKSVAADVEHEAALKGVEQFNSGAESSGSGGCRASPSRHPREMPHCKPKAVPRAKVDIMVQRLARPPRQMIRKSAVADVEHHPALKDGEEQFNSGAESSDSGGCRASPSRPPCEMPDCKPKAAPRAQVDIMIQRLARPPRQILRKSVAADVEHEAALKAASARRRLRSAKEASEIIQRLAQRKDSKQVTSARHVRGQSVQRPDSERQRHPEPLKKVKKVRRLPGQTTDGEGGGGKGEDTDFDAELRGDTYASRSETQTLESQISLPVPSMTLPPDHLDSDDLQARREGKDAGFFEYCGEDLDLDCDLPGDLVQWAPRPHDFKSFPRRSDTQMTWPSETPMRSRSMSSEADSPVLLSPRSRGRAHSEEVLLRLGRPATASTCASTPAGLLLTMTEGAEDYSRGTFTGGHESSPADRWSWSKNEAESESQLLLPLSLPTTGEEVGVEPLRIVVPLGAGSLGGNEVEEVELSELSEEMLLNM